MLSRPEKVDAVEVVETQRDDSGKARMAGVGEANGEGEDRRREG